MEKFIYCSLKKSKQQRLVYVVRRFNARKIRWFDASLSVFAIPIQIGRLMTLRLHANFFSSTSISRKQKFKIRSRTHIIFFILNLWNCRMPVNVPGYWTLHNSINFQTSFLSRFNCNQISILFGWTLRLLLLCVWTQNRFILKLKKIISIIIVGKSVCVGEKRESFRTK